MKKENLSESIAAGGVLLLASCTVSILLILRRILHLIYLNDYLKNIKPSPFDNPIDEVRTKKLQKIVNSTTEPIVHKMKIGDYVNAFSDGSIHIYYTVPLEKMATEDELIAVLLHEYGHYKEKHVFHRYKTHLVSELILQAALSGISAIIGLNAFQIVLFSLKFLLTDEVLTKIYTLLYSQTNEFVADSYAKKYGYEKHMISFLKKIEDEEKKKYCKSIPTDACLDRLKDLHKGSTHPTSAERIKKLLSKIIPKFVSVRGKDIKKFRIGVKKLGEDFFRTKLKNIDQLQKIDILKNKFTGSDFEV